ncbi:hypothetical protein [Kiloniella laminariae]|uniref:hypothetical protein n=1 Tax=Kiloniella laminariae TaxID=454162 RepID=UPI00037CBA5E|nr:hypothetical protein [Kiloniella laminariae]
MKYITISDDDIDFTTSKWLLYSLLTRGCTRFSVDLVDVPGDSSSGRKEKLRESLKPFYMGVSVLDRMVAYNGEPFHKPQDCWKLNQDSLMVILRYMGRHLLDWDVELNSGISSWRFFFGDTLIAEAVYGSDHFLFFEPPDYLLKVLAQKNIPVSYGEEA